MRLRGWMACSAGFRGFPPEAGVGTMPVVVLVESLGH
jgi:hypothetical protein